MKRRRCDHHHIYISSSDDTISMVQAYCTSGTRYKVKFLFICLYLQCIFTTYIVIIYFTNCYIHIFSSAAVSVFNKFSSKCKVCGQCQKVLSSSL